MKINALRKTFKLSLPSIYKFYFISFVVQKTLNQNVHIEKKNRLTGTNQNYVL